MPRKKLFFILFFLFSGFFSHAQNPGYLGKKLYGGYDFHFYIGGIDPDARRFDQWYAVYQPLWFINSYHEGHLDYVLSRFYSLGVSVQGFQTGQYYHEQGTIIYSSSYSNYTTDNYLNMRGTTFMVNNKLFYYGNGTALAPVGNYFQIGIGATAVKSTSKIKGMNIHDSYTDDINRIVTHQNFTTAVFSLGFGKQSVFLDRLIIDLGAEGTFFPGAVKAWAGDSNTSGIGNYPKEENARLAALTRLQTFYSTSVKLGVGLLLF